MTGCCLVVIGHVDHGKTALVQRLTGIDTDRLAEEKVRGLSIVAGYAHHTYASGTVDFVDAPGHGDFVQAMISAASGARAALVVISAVEGIAAQTREHLAIAGLLGLTDAVIAVTKSDLLLPDALSARLGEIRAGLADSPFKAAPMIPCSAATGSGIARLHDTLEALVRRVPQAGGPVHRFLPIDRAFTLPGRGTIVTGTLLGGELASGDDLLLQPGARPVTVRGLHSRDTARDVVGAGGRTAVNLRGLSVKDVPRGGVLCDAAAGAATTCIDVHLSVLPDAMTDLKHMQEVRLHVGSAHTVAQIRLFAVGRLASGQSGFAQLRLRSPVMAHAGQHAILRRLSPLQTLGGAVVLDPQAPPSRAGDTARVQVLCAAQAQEVTQIARSVMAAQGGVAALSQVARLSRRTVIDTRGTLGDGVVQIALDTITSADAIAACRADLMALLSAYHATHPARPVVPFTALAPRGCAADLLDHVRQELIRDGTCRTSDRGVALTQHDPMTALPTDQQTRLAQIATTWRDAGLAPPARSQILRNEMDKDLLDLLIDRGHVCALPNVALKQTVVLHDDALRAATAALRRAFPPPAPFTTGEARAALGTSRRVIVPLLEHLDTLAVTTREGDRRRIAGPYPVPPSSSA